MSSGVEADIALDAAVILSLGMNRVAGKVAGLTAVGAEALAALAQGRADARAAALAEAERQDRVLREVIGRNARIGALAETQREHGLDVPLPAPLPPGDHTPDELTAWCAATDEALNEAERRISQHRAAQVSAQVFAVPADGLRADLGWESADKLADLGGQTDDRIAGLGGGAEDRPAHLGGEAHDRSAGPGGEAHSRSVGPGGEVDDRTAGSGGGSSDRTAGWSVGPGGEAHSRSAGSGGEAGDLGATAGGRRVVTLARVLARLAPDTNSGDHDRVKEAAGLLAEARTDGEAEGLLTEVRLRVQHANRRTELRREEERRRAAERGAAEQAEAERRYVLETVTTAFQEMGYEVDAGFETLTAQDGAVVLTRGNWPDHSVRMRVEDAGQLRAAMVRTRAPANEDDRRRDTEREREWCAAFEAARDRLAEAGISSEVTWRVEPGDQELPVTAPARQTRGRVGQKARQRERGADET